MTTLRHLHGRDRLSCPCRPFLGVLCPECNGESGYLPKPPPCSCQSGPHPGHVAVAPGQRPTFCYHNLFPTDEGHSESAPMADAAAPLTYERHFGQILRDVFVAGAAWRHLALAGMPMGAWATREAAREAASRYPTQANNDAEADGA